jgi:hypothetical protein
LSQVALKLHPVEPLDALLLVRLDEEVLLGVRHVQHGKDERAHALGVLVCRSPDGEEFKGRCVHSCLVIGQRSQQQGVHHAEDGRIRANAQTERQHGNQREAGILQQHSRAVAQVLPKCLHRSPHFVSQCLAVRFIIGASSNRSTCYASNPNRIRTVAASRVADVSP